MILAGVDPGLRGGVSFLDTSTGALAVHPMPVHELTRNGKAKSEIDMVGLADLFGDTVGHAFVEQIGAMPGQGVSSTFAFGKGYGIVLGILAARSVPFTLVTPQKWKKALNVPADKDGARARASQLMPKSAHEWKRVKDDGKAESALIALYGSRVINTVGEC